MGRRFQGSRGWRPVRAEIRSAGGGSRAATLLVPVPDLTGLDSTRAGGRSRTRPWVLSRSLPWLADPNCLAAFCPDEHPIWQQSERAR